MLILSRIGKREKDPREPTTKKMLGPTAIQDDELQAMKDCFALFDTNGDGEIDANELQAGFESFGQTRRRSSIIRMINAADKNQNQKVDFEEFVSLMALAGKAADEAIENMKIKTAPTNVDLEERERKQRFKRPTWSRDDISASVYGNFAATEEIVETPEMIANNMADFDKEMESMSAKEKHNATLAMEKCPEQIDDKFKLAFLRAERFDAKKSVIRFCLYWDYMVDLFGLEKAFLPLTQEGALKDDKEILSIPFGVDTTKKDKHGQAIFFVDRKQSAKGLDPKAVARASLYVFLRRIFDDEDAQKNGVVILFHSPQSISEWNPTVSKYRLDFTRHAAPVRVAAAHFCQPPLFMNIMFRLMRIMAGELALRMRIITGEGEELIAKLNAFGIERSAAPVALGGELVLDHAQWLKDQAEKGL